jgi:hypothetical protein
MKALPYILKQLLFAGLVVGSVFLAASDVEAGTYTLTLTDTSKSTFGKVCSLSMEPLAPDNFASAAPRARPGMF